MAYVNLDYNKYEINKYINEDFLQNDSNKNISMTPLLPLQEIKNVDTLVFNKFEEESIPYDFYRKDQSGVLRLMPLYEFYPYNFSYEVTIKKNMGYSIGRNYNINIACIDDADSLDLSSRLSKIFINPSSLKLVPPNISINNNVENISALTDSSFDECDFVFMESFDGKILDLETRQEAPISSLLEKNVNCWIGCDEHHLYKHKVEGIGYVTFSSTGTFNDFELKRSLLSTNKTIYSNVYFNLDNVEFKKDGINIYNMFTKELSPVLIIEHKGKGFEIISHNDVLRYPEKYKDLIYEVLMYVYLMSYKRSKRVAEWITKSVPDYEVINGTLYSKKDFLSHTTLSDLFNMTMSDFYIYQIDVYDNSGNELPDTTNDLSNYPVINYTDIINNRIVFNMENTTSLYTEIDKPLNHVSIYKDGKIYYLSQMYYYIESNISNKVFLTEQGDNLIVKIYPFKSSKYNLNIKVDKTVIINDIKTNVNNVSRIIEAVYTIYYNKDIEELEYCLLENYDDTNTRLVKILDIEIKQAVDNTYLTDMRQLGGGLSLEAKDDYDLLDIGHADGRPYRKSNTLIVKIPKKYEPYKEQILQTIEKYKVGEDYPIILFEDEE